MVNISLNDVDMQVSKAIASEIAELVIFNRDNKNMDFDQAFLKAFEDYDLDKQIFVSYLRKAKSELNTTKAKILIEQVKLDAALLLKDQMQENDRLKEVSKYLKDKGLIGGSDPSKPLSPIPKRIEANKGSFAAKIDKEGRGAVVKIKKGAKKGQTQQFTIDCEGDQKAFAEKMDKGGKKYLVGCKPDERDDK